MSLAFGGEMEDGWAFEEGFSGKEGYNMKLGSTEILWVRFSQVGSDIETQFNSLLRAAKLHAMGHGSFRFCPRQSGLSEINRLLKFHQDRGASGGAQSTGKWN